MFNVLNIFEDLLIKRMPNKKERNNKEQREKVR